MGLDMLDTGLIALGQWTMNGYLKSTENISNSVIIPGDVAYDLDDSSLLCPFLIPLVLMFSLFAMVFCGMEILKL